MSNPHVELTLRAALVAAHAIRVLAEQSPILGPPNGEMVSYQEVLRSLHALYEPAPPPPPRIHYKRPPRPPKPRAPAREVEAPPPPAVRREAIEDEESDWDPEPLYEASRCKALLMEVIRRAVSDYVLYRQHRKLELKELAEQAFIWLFEEEPGHPAWKQRERSLFQGKNGDGQTFIEVGSRRLTSFLSICEVCGLDPDVVRQRARETTVESVMRTGRRYEHRQQRGSSSSSISLEMHELVDVDLAAIEAEHQPLPDYYEAREAYGIDSAW